MRAILTYHSIDSSGSPISITAEAFQEHIRWLTSGAVRVTTVEELLLLEPEADAVALTFDDGYSNFRSRAWPHLREKGFPVTLFVVASAVGGTNAWGGKPLSGIPELSLLDWDALAHLQEEGVTLGSHTLSHAWLPSVVEGRLEQEVWGSAEVIEERTGVRPKTFAYPFGAVDERSRSVTSHEYSLACTTELRALGRQPDRYLLPRLDAYYYRNPEKLGRWGSAAFRSRVWIRNEGRKLKSRLRAQPAVWGRRENSREVSIQTRGAGA